ncbi:hypothetical protein CHUAL_013834 [Chamberlinius hualienensis]
MSGHSEGREERHRCTPVKCRHYIRLFLTHLFSHVGLCGLVVGYAVIGAFTFEALEAKQEIKLRDAIRDHRKECLKELWRITLNLNVFYEENYTIIVDKRLKEFEERVVFAVKNEGYDGKDRQDQELQWSFSGALLYSVTVITTIGYGNIAPKTDSGKVVTIVYALFGVPLMLLCLTNIGDIFANAFKFAYSRVCCVLCRDKRKYVRGTSMRAVHCDGAVKYIAHNQPQTTKLDSTSSSSPHVSKRLLTAVDIINETKKGVDDPPDSPPQKLSPTTSSTTNNKAMLQHELNAQDHLMETDIVNIERVPNMMTLDDTRVPIYLVLGIVSFYICLGALIFSYWEGWTFMNGAYFCFITLSTIGFGDLVPGSDLLHDKSDTGQAKLILCCFYLILGLAIIAMSFNLVQEEVTAKCKQIGRNLGILDDDADNDD